MAEVTKDGAWVCNQCGSEEFTGAVSEDALEDDGMSCTNCGGTEFHWKRVTIVKTTTRKAHMH